MRLVILVAAIAAIASFMMVPRSAEAGGYHRVPHDYSICHTRSWRRGAALPRARHVYYAEYCSDPYEYRYAPTRYYPYYNSRYWKPARYFRKGYRTLKKPPYYKAWGYSKRRYRKVRRRWHR